MSDIIKIKPTETDTCTCGTKCPIIPPDINNIETYIGSAYCTEECSHRGKDSSENMVHCNILKAVKELEELAE